MSFFSQCVELPAFLLYIAFMLETSTTTNFIIYRTCYVSLGYNESDCALLGSNDKTDKIEKLEASVQPTASVVMMLRSVLAAILPAIYCFIIGPWTNKYGRKPIMIYGFIGIMMTYLTFMIVALMKLASPWWTLVTAGTTIFGGGFCGLLTAIFCFITDVTTINTRSVKMGMLELSVGIGSAVGIILCSPLLRTVGYSGAYGVCAALTALALFYTIFLIQESVVIIEKKDRLKNLFNLSVIIHTLKVVFKPRENCKRLIFFLLIAVLMLAVAPLFGDLTVGLLFLRKHFHWSLSKCNLFAALNNVVDIVASAFVIIVINRILKVKEMIIIISSLALMLSGSLIFLFSLYDWQLYLGSLLKRTNLSLLPLTRAAISKVIPHEDLGQVFAFTTALEMLNQAVSAPIYTFVYNASLNTFDNGYGILSVVLYTFGFIAANTVIFIRRR